MASPAQTIAQPHSQKGYFPVLDALRFVLALWVAIGHYDTIPIFGSFDTGTGYWLLFKHLWRTTVFGTPAVIVFFVISGFCIHLPFRGTEKIPVARYYLRRYTRILIPVLGALIIYRWVGKQQFTLWGEHSILWESPLWSLACEEIYYAAYPFLRWLRNLYQWKILLPVSFASSVAVSLTHPRDVSWHTFGPFGTAVMLLPVWLLGCLLAEESMSAVAMTPKMSIWVWRFLAWFGCWTSEMLHFKLGISYTQTMVWFGVLAYLWVRQEIIHGREHRPNSWLVAAGAWSYSLYLMHTQGGTLYGWLHIPKLGLLAEWFIIMTCSLVFAYVFFLLVERPSHKLARKFRVKSAGKALELEKGSQSLPLENNPIGKEPAQV
jgi:peptidoglycan/LPS O-acetylase OafA/YrhL